MDLACYCYLQRNCRINRNVISHHKWMQQQRMFFMALIISQLLFIAHFLFCAGSKSSPGAIYSTFGRSNAQLSSSCRSSWDLIANPNKTKSRSVVSHKKMIFLFSDKMAKTENGTKQRAGSLKSFEQGKKGDAHAVDSSISDRLWLEATWMNRIRPKLVFQTQKLGSSVFLKALTRTNWAHKAFSSKPLANHLMWVV